jgi:hypothetical protein
MSFTHFLEATEKFVFYPLQDKPVGGLDSHEISAGGEAEGFNPIIELLWGKLLLKTAQTSLPESFH